MCAFKAIRDRVKEISFNDPSKFTRAQKFIEQNKKKLEDSSVFFNPDTAFQPAENYSDANLRVLIVFGSPASVKAVSSTAAALNSFVTEICNSSRTKEQNAIPKVNGARPIPEPNERGPLKVFMDFTYVPNGSDMKLFDKNNMPYAIGNITHLDASYFDVVGFSISVLSEVITCPNIIKSFSRCDYPIPLTWTERKGETLGKYPLIYAGGITAACSDIMFGDLGDGRQAFVDFLYLGSCEKMDIMWERHIEAIDHNRQIDEMAVPEGEEIPPFPPLYHHNGVDLQGLVSTQDYINSIFDMPMVYQPQAYKVVFDNRNRVIENTKINEYAQDFVKPYYPLEIDEDCLGIGMTIIQASGDNVGTSQIQVSEGAMLKGTLIRTSKGLKRVEELAPREIGDEHVFEGPFVDTTGEVGVISHAFNHGVRKLRLFTLKSGIQIGLTDEHPVEQWRIGESKTSFKKAGELVEGDFFMLKKRSSVCGNSEMNESEAEFLGRMLGDGSYNLYDDSRGDRKPYHKMYLACDWEEVDYCEDLLERANILYTKDIEQGRHCRFWIKSEDKKGRRLDSDFWGFNQRYGEWENHTQGKKYIPAPAYQFDYIQMKAFLKGFHDADGCSSTNNGLSKVTFDSCHEHIINDVQQFLLFVGIPTTKHYYKKHRVADDELGFKETDNDHWCLNVSSEYFSEFNDLGVLKKAYCRNTNSKEKLPFDIETIRAIIYGREVSTEQRSRAFAAVRRNSFTKELAKKMGIDYPDFFYDEIISIEEVEGEVYDLTVPKLEKLIANGCSIHNCSAAGACSFCAEGNYCLPAGTLIKSTEGLTKIEDFKVGDYVVLSENKFKVLNKVIIEPKILKKIELFNHQILKVADTHLMLTIENGKLRYKRAYDLKEGDFLVYDRTQAFGSFKTDYAYLIGLIIGDGMFYPDKKTIEVDFSNFDISSSIDGEFERLCDKWHYSKKTDDCSAAVCYSDKITKELISIGLQHQTAKSKRIPEKFFNSDKETAKCLLQGLFDSDGGISLNKSGKASIYYSSVNYDLIEDVVKMLSMFGIVASIYPSDRDEGGHFKKDGEFIKNSEATYDVVIVGEKNQQIFEDEIGFRLERKKNLLLQRVPYEWDVEYLPTFESRIRDLYLSNKEFNRFTRKNNDSLRKVVMGWTTKMHWLSKRHLLKGMEFYDKKLLDDIEDAKRFEFIQIINIEDGGKEQMYDIEVEDSHAYSIHGWVSHNTGGWVEKSKERILWEARESKKYSAGYKMKPFSFNCNYVTDYKGILYDFMKIYPKVTFINMRMEELGRDVDALRMMKLVGSNRISAPMEGISPRIQNNLLNKCLSEEALTNFMDDMVHARLTDIKVGGIFTGYEEDEDFQWICDFVDRYKQRAAMENGNFPFRLKVTPLVHYNLTPIEYLERKSARKSYEGEHWLTDEWYEKFREHNVFFKVNGFRYSTFIEQSIIDLGRSATKWMYDNIVSQNLPVYSLRSFATKEIVDNLKKIVNKDWFFEARNPEHYISISHRIHIDLMGSYIPRARRLVRLAEQGKILDNPMDIRCLKTFADAKTKCYASCVSKDPLKIYKDVKLDENDNLVGEFRELKGCERCPDKEHRMNRLARPIISSKNSEDIIALPKLKPVQRVRFVLRRTAEYCVLNPNNTAHTFMAKFLQKSERLVDIYHSIAGHNFFWQSDADIPYEVSGFQVVDALFTSNEAYSIIESLANEVSRELKSVKIISFKKEFVEDTIKVNDFNIYRFETSLPYDLFASACISYKGEIRVKKDVLLETITDKSLKKPVFITAGKTIGYFVLPMKYNPYLYLQGLLKDKKIPLTKLRQEVNIDNVLIARESSNICTCGKEKGVISLITGKQMKFGLDCLPTALMKVELNKKK